jgi:hypothetical protein
VRWHNTVTIGQNGVELDALPPTTSGSSNTFFEINGYLHPQGSGVFRAYPVLSGM